MIKTWAWLAAPLAALALAGPASAQDAGGTLKKIADARSITIGYRADAAPFSFTAADGQAAGYSIDLCKRVVGNLERDLKLPTLAVKWVPVSSSNRIPELLNGTIDLECGTSTVTLGRQEQVDFSNLIFVDGGGLLTRSESPVDKVADLAGKSVGAMSGTTTETALRNTLARMKVDARVVAVADEQEGLAALRAGRIDALASDRVKLVVLAARTTNPADFALLAADFSFEPYAIMMRRDPALRLAVNRALSQTYLSPALGEIYDRWFGVFGRPGPLLAAMYYLNATPE